MLHLHNPPGQHNFTQARLLEYPIEENGAISTPILNTTTTIEYCNIDGEISKMGSMDGTNYHFWCQRSVLDHQYSLYTINEATKTIVKAGDMLPILHPFNIVEHIISPFKNIIPERPEFANNSTTGMLIDDEGQLLQFDILSNTKPLQPMPALLWVGGGNKLGELRVAKFNVFGWNPDAERSMTTAGVIAVVGGSLAVIVGLAIMLRNRLKRWETSDFTRRQGDAGDNEAVETAAAIAAVEAAESRAHRRRRADSITSIEHPPPPYEERSDSFPPPPPLLDDEDCPPGAYEMRPV
ncbi:hypothetical protein BGZ73_002459 [Actinomortierella ambigua]|nr:hypothetical protein BGZ73_002459 [Actinomortierella ambigua]